MVDWGGRGRWAKTMSDVSAAMGSDRAADWGRRQATDLKLASAPPGFPKRSTTCEPQLGLGSVRSIVVETQPRAATGTAATIVMLHSAPSSDRGRPCAPCIAEAYPSGQAAKHRVLAMLESFNLVFSS